MKIAVGSDHGGFQLKEAVKGWLLEKGYEVEDKGTYDEQSCDYPDFGEAVARDVAAGIADKGILVCGTGIGISIAANKIKGIRAAVCGDTFSARMSRLHNDANILAMGQRVVGAGLALDIAEIWLNTSFEGGRHEGRVEKIRKIEETGAGWTE